jgi:predicted esterase
MDKLHQGQPLLTAGTLLEEANVAMVLLHGRGASAKDILTLADELNALGVAYLAPQAAGHQWYPNRFLAPVASNEPWLTSALNVLLDLQSEINRVGIPSERIAWLGFSQGACLALEFAARHPQRYGGVFGLSGALIENGDQVREYVGSLAKTPVFLGCSDVDFHIPLARVQRSTHLLQQLGAQVTQRIYPGMGHTVNQDELGFVQATLDALATPVGE